MKTEDKKRLFTFLYVLLIAVVITTCIVGMIWLKSESATCLLDPIQYYSEKTSQLCYCNDGLGWLKP